MSGAGVTWYSFACPACGSPAFIPVDAGAAVPSRYTCYSSRCKRSVDPRTLATPCDPPSAEQQFMATIDAEIVADPPPPLPKYLEKANDKLVAELLMPTGRALTPILNWFYDVFEEPEVRGCVRIYTTPRLSRRAGAWGWTWALRRWLLLSYAPICISPNVIVCVAPIVLTLVGILGMFWCESNAIMPLRNVYLSGTLEVVKVFGITSALTSIMVLLRLTVIDPGYVTTPLEVDDPEAPMERANWALRAAGRCIVCLTERPKRSGHCKQCQVCVRQFDHHCNVLGVCVGEHTFPYFAWYCLTIQLGLNAGAWWWLFVFGWMPRSDPALPTDPSGAVATLGAVAVVVRPVLCLFLFVLFFGGAVFVASMNLNIVQTYVTGTTVRERVLRKKGNDHRAKKTKALMAIKKVVDIYGEEVAYRDYGSIIENAKAITREADPDDDVGPFDHESCTSRMTTVLSLRHADRNSRRWFVRGNTAGATAETV